MKSISMKGARVNNLKDVTLDIPINKITSFIGPSGSGKTSLAFHTLFNESKRRFLNSFPTYLKFFSDRPSPVDIDQIEPVLPVFGLPQINPVSGTRSNAADIMHITSELQTLYSTYSKHFCPRHNIELEKSNFDAYLLNLFKDSEVDENEVFHLFITKDDFIEYFRNLPFPSRSIKSVRSKKIEDFDEAHEMWEIFRFKWKSLGKLEEKLKNYLNKPIQLTLIKKSNLAKLKLEYSKKLKCPKCEYSEGIKLTPYYFSPYNALGACSECNGFGNKLIYDREKYINMEESISNGAIKMIESNRFSSHKEHFLKYVKRNKISLSKKVRDMDSNFFNALHEGDGSWVGLNSFFKYLERKKYKAPVRIYIRGIQKEITCQKCEGSRINELAHNFTVGESTDLFYKEIWKDSISNLLKKLQSIPTIPDKLYKQMLDKILTSLKLAESIGLGHLEINRKAKSLSSGEYQRLLLLKYLSYEGTGGLFIFDEPSLGLDTKECEMLFKGFKKLIDQKNTVILIEHNKYLINKSDYVVEMGPGAGKFGGEVVFTGKKKLQENKKFILEPQKITKNKRKWVSVVAPNLYSKNFKSFKIPYNEFTCVTGSSGSGKTSSIVNTLCVEALKRINKYESKVIAGTFKSIDIPENFEDVIVIDSNLNRYSSRSTIGSLTGLVGMLRKHFLKTKVANSMGLKDGHMSSNSVLGQCPACQGRGVNIVEMQFLEDVVLTCEDCNGMKIKPLYANLSDGKRSYYQCISSPLNEIIEDINLTPKFKKIWEFMKLLNLDYLSLDRTIQSLSGGEKQRIYLLSKLTSKIENNLIVFENISFGLSDIEQYKLALFLQKLSIINTVVVIDQSNLLKAASSYSIDF